MPAVRTRREKGPDDLPARGGGRAFRPRVPPLRPVTAPRDPARHPPSPAAAARDGLVEGYPSRASAKVGATAVGIALA